MGTTERPPIYFPPFRSTLVFSYTLKPRAFLSSPQEGRWMCVCVDTPGIQRGDEKNWLVEIIAESGPVLYTSWHKSFDEAMVDVEEMQ